MQARAVQVLRSRKPNSDQAALNSGTGRMRVVEGAEIKVIPLPTCSITSSENSLSVINNGGSVGIIVGIAGRGRNKGPESCLEQS